MIKNLLRAGAFMLALMLVPLASASAHDKHGRKRRHGRARRQVVKTHDDDRNPTPGIPRGSLSGTPSTFPTDEGRKLGREVRRGEEKGVGKGVGKRVGVTRGRGKH
jgi:hypothetical protein